MYLATSLLDLLSLYISTSPCFSCRFSLSYRSVDRVQDVTIVHSMTLWNPRRDATSIIATIATVYKAIFANFAILAIRVTIRACPTEEFLDDRDRVLARDTHNRHCACSRPRDDRCNGVLIASG